jgi:hypothetical protein
MTHERILIPMVDVYFKNIGQTRSLIQLLQGCCAIQLQSSQEVKWKVY